MSQFVDECQIHVKAGDGGAGCVSFRREAHVSHGGPDGGNGGGGGDVWLVADHNIASLIAFRDQPFRRAADGTHGKGKKKHGSSGDDRIVSVPEGTVVRDRTGNVATDLVRSGDRYLAAHGGQGGRGNARFLSNRRRAPSFAEQGEAGEDEWLNLELKLLADVALVGYPNVGKSTLISRISAAKPKIADYPFTTLEPNLGVVRMDDEFEMVVADVPGIIEGASEGRGLGHQFLRHIERARVLVVLVDVAADVGSPPPADQERVLLAELERYRPELLERERIVVGSRSDLRGDGDDWTGSAVSAVTGDGVASLVGAMVGAVRRAREAPVVGEAFVVHRPDPSGFRVERGPDGFVVVGRPAERAVALSDLTDVDALDHAQYRLRKLGVPRALARAGATPGDTVRIGDHEFEYQPDGEGLG